MAPGVRADRDTARLWRPDIPGVEVLHARFRRHAYPRHAHDATTVALMDSGTAAFQCEGAEFAAPAGSAFMINPGAVHTGRSATPEGYRYRVLYLTEEAFSTLLPGKPGKLTFPARHTVVQDRELLTALDHTNRVLAMSGQRLAQEESLLRLGLALRRFADAPPVARASGRGHRAVATVRDYLESDPAARISLTELAWLASTSPYRLVRLFAAELGMPPHAYQVELRVRLARRLLESGARVATAASEAGFCDQAHLTRVFKRYTGVTPGQFAQAARANRPRRLAP
ncbi:AraC family transcriptional regulator [Actinokineospora iranica]|uniref:AraC-type DNA-binding protein n=1 Tax=Actinokineospora iranica TaxID=1271860 RepID=A0A1G6QX52_9PSEU|nr:AraC family transcriptional regulator [Actinokineospora iranica]SDC97049.1 AraC-type DNA-binding protein [Actinokineospora iranica]